MTIEPITPLNEMKISPEPNSGCWLWLGDININGYGRMYYKSGNHRKMAHRVVYESHFGPIPDGLELDHLCRTRSCVNPAHLEPVTKSVNAKRGLTPRLNAERGKIITHCPHGHEYTSENTYIRENPKGWASRKCRTCARLRELERYAKLKAQDDFGRRRERKVPRYRDPEEWR